jgi:hypothetical protein
MHPFSFTHEEKFDKSLKKKKTNIWGHLGCGRTGIPTLLCRTLQHPASVHCDIVSISQILMLSEDVFACNPACGRL